MVTDPGRVRTYSMSPILHTPPIDALTVEQGCLFFLLLEEIVYTYPYNQYTHANGQSTTPGNER